MPGRHQAAALDLLSPERDNLRTAIAWAIAHGEADIGLRHRGRSDLVLGPARRDRGGPDRALAALLAMPGADAPTRGRMRALEAAGTIDYYGGTVDHAAELLRSPAGARPGARGPARDRRRPVQPPVHATSLRGSRRSPAARGGRGDLSVDRSRTRARGASSWTRGAGLGARRPERRRHRPLAHAFEQCLRLDDVTYQVLAASSLGATYAELGRSRGGRPVVHDGPRDRPRHRRRGRHDPGAAHRGVRSPSRSIGPDAGRDDARRLRGPDASLRHHARRPVWRRSSLRARAEARIARGHGRAELRGRLRPWPSDDARRGKRLRHEPGRAGSAPSSTTADVRRHDEPDPELPTGTVTFLFSDIEGSTRLVGELDPLLYREVLEQHNEIDPDSCLGAWRRRARDTG